MILLIDIFMRADLIYVKVLLVNASCIHYYADSDEFATIMGEICVLQGRTTGSHDRVDIRRNDQCFNLLLWCHCFFLYWVHVYNMDQVSIREITGMRSVI